MEKLDTQDLRRPPVDRANRSQVRPRQLSISSIVDLEPQPAVADRFTSGTMRPNGRCGTRKLGDTARGLSPHQCCVAASPITGAQPRHPNRQTSRRGIESDLTVNRQRLRNRHDSSPPRMGWNT